MQGNVWNVLLKLSFFIGLSMYASFVHAQIFQAKYLFDGAISEESAGDDPTFIIQETVTDASEVVYTTGIDDQAVYLDSASGFILPMEVTDGLMASDIWSFKMRFKIADFGAGNGQRMLINLKRGGTNTAPYFRIFANKSNESNGRVVFQMHDRNGNNIQQHAFYFALDEWVNLTFIIDFANQNFTLAGDSYYVSANFESFDYGNFKTFSNDNSLDNQRFYIGYYSGLRIYQQSSNETYKGYNSAALVIDELTVSNTTPETDINIFENALIHLTDQLNGVTTLSETEISTYTSQVLTNFKGNYLSSKAIVNAYFQAYEAAYDPMFKHDNNVVFYDHYDEFGWVLFNLQIDVFDNYVTNDHLSEVGELAFETADAFPGPVAETAERLDNQTVTINGTFELDPGYNGVLNDDSYTTSARRGTGYYAAPGEMVSVEVPTSLVGIGAEVVIGSFTQDVSGKIATGIRRFPRPIKQFEIINETMNVMSPLGGIIYIYVPNGSYLGNIDITISGAVKFAYYEQSSTNLSDLTEFQAMVESGEVLWAEVVTDIFMYTAPLAYFKRDDIVETLSTWDKMWEAYQLYNGRPYPLHRAEHLVIDKMTKWNTLAGGYPMVLTWGTAPFITDFWANVGGANMMNILDFEQAIKDEKATYWHEMTHHTNVPTLPTETECIVEMAYVVANHVGLGMPLDSAMKYSERGFFTRNDAIIDWVIEPNFRNDEEMTSLQRRYQQRGYSKYVDIGVLFGWDSLGLINKVFYDEWTAMGGQVNDPDGFRITDTEWILASNEALNVNVAPLYHFWGEQPHDSIMNAVNAYPRSKKIYQHLREIRDFIPETPEGFQRYFDDHAADSEDPTYDYNYALSNWNSNLLYDSIIMQIDSILFWYYDGDFDQDGVLFYDDCDDTDASIQAYDLIVNIEACNGFDFDGNTLTASGTYNGTFVSVHGCDSLVTLNLSILHSTDSILHETACDSYDFLGTLLTNSGEYQQTIPNSVGCDSLITLNLTILEPDETTINETTCSEFEFFGSRLTESGVYQEMLVNSAGCDSVVTLNLTIHGAVEVDTIMAVCDKYILNGQVLTESGNYSALFPRFSGCDSLVNLSLTILNPEGVECNGSVTGLGDESGMEQIRVFPNPTVGQIAVDLVKEYSQVKLDILSTSGRLIQSEIFANTSLIRTKLDLSSGTFVMRITADGIIQGMQHIIKK